MAHGLAPFGTIRGFDRLQVGPLTSTLSSIVFSLHLRKKIEHRYILNRSHRLAPGLVLASLRGPVLNHGRMFFVAVPVNVGKLK